MKEEKSNRRKKRRRERKRGKKVRNTYLRSGSVVGKTDGIEKGEV